ncbi:MAG TPA: two-component system response regulator KdpE [Methylophilaceae bacterium]|jgi:two-component system KDP operon response regulator KdpE
MSIEANKPVVLIIEDEAQIRRFVRMALEAEDCIVHESETMQRGLIDTGTRHPDLVILDLGLPDGDGVDFIRDLRNWSQIPVIVLSARSEESDKVKALNSGADDYLTKPFGTAELVARVKAHLRRTTNNNNSPVITFGDIKMDMQKRMVERAGEAIHLTALEYRLLAYLATNSDCVLTHRHILKAVWGPSHIEDTHYVRVYMGHLRKKLEASPSQPRHIITESSVGYRFVR